jgi:hypothetical protein
MGNRDDQEKNLEIARKYRVFVYKYANGNF